MRAELHAVLVQLAQVAKAPDLKASGIGEDGALPRHESVEAAHFADSVNARPQIEVVGIPEQDLHAQIVECVLGYAFDRALGSDRHEDRRLHGGVRQMHVRAASGAVVGDQFEAQGHALILSLPAENPGADCVLPFCAHP